MTDGESPRSIGRFWQKDPSGTLLIGETVVGRTRFKELVGAVEGRVVGRGHGPGATFHTWFRTGRSSPENIVFEFLSLGPAMSRLGKMASPKTCAWAAELLLLERYRWLYGDLPPCNTQGPKWHAVTKWMAKVWNMPWAYVASDLGPEARLNIPLIAVPDIPALSVEDALSAGLRAANERAGA